MGRPKNQIMLSSLQFIACRTWLPTSLPFQIGFKNQTGVEPEPLTVDKAVSLVQDVFSAAAERDIYTGDGLKLHVISASGVEVREVTLRRD